MTLLPLNINSPTNTHRQNLYPLKLFCKETKLTWSDIVNLMAVTTVLRVRADWELRWFLRLVRRFAGSIRVNFPRHSDTTFLVPSSGHSQWLNNMDLKGNSEVMVNYLKRAIMKQWLNNMDLKGNSEVTVNYLKMAIMKQWLWTWRARAKLHFAISENNNEAKAE